MPLIEVQANGRADRAQVSRAIAAEVAEVLDARPDAAWVVWRPLADDDVTIGQDSLAATQGMAIAHVYLTRTPEQVEAVADAVSRTLESELGLDESRVLVCTHAFAL